MDLSKLLLFMVTEAEISQLTSEEMKTYKKSIMEYADVQDAMAYARDEGKEKWIEIGRKHRIPYNIFHIQFFVKTIRFSTNILLSIKSRTNTQ